MTSDLVLKMKLYLVETDDNCRKTWLIDGLIQSKRARHFCRPFVLTNPLNSIAKLQIGATIKN